VHRFSVAGAAEESGVGAECQAGDSDAPFDASPELPQPAAVGYVEHPDDSAPLRGRRQLLARVAEGHRSKGRVVSRDHDFGALRKWNPLLISEQILVMQPAQLRCNSYLMAIM